MTAYNYVPPERLRLNGEVYVRADEPEKRFGTVEVVRADVYRALVRELETLRGKRSPVETYKSTTVRGRP